MGLPIKEGDMVAYSDMLGCGKCAFCRQGSANICKDVKMAGLKPGVFVEYYTYPMSQIIKMEGINSKHGALVEPVSTTLHANRRADVKIGDKVLVIGAGAIGLLRVQLLINQGAATIIVAEIQEMKRKIAQELGADIVVDPRKEDLIRIVEDVTNGYGADVVFEDVGLPHLQLMALDAARPHGTVMMMGISQSPVSLNFLDKVQFKELTIKGTIGVARQWDRRHDYYIAADLIKTGKIQIDPMITHEFSIEKYDEAFRTSEDSSRAIKVLIKVT
jgi:2-desacetyl-2-hydroxyethyl bacteriochlorophyllide A dehydrogenase